MSTPLYAGYNIPAVALIPARSHGLQRETAPTIPHILEPNLAVTGAKQLKTGQASGVRRR